MTRIKLCGLTRPEDIEAANGLLPDYIGFVFAPKSRRFVTPEQAAEMASQSDGAIVGSAIIRMITEYGEEAPARVGEYVKRMKEAIAQVS